MLLFFFYFILLPSLPTPLALSFFNRCLAVRMCPLYQFSHFHSFHSMRTECAPASKLRYKLKVFGDHSFVHWLPLLLICTVWAMQEVHIWLSLLLSFSLPFFWTYCFSLADHQAHITSILSPRYAMMLLLPLLMLLFLRLTHSQSYFIYTRIVYYVQFITVYNFTI